jgi:hypothetical protein
MIKELKRFHKTLEENDLLKNKFLSSKVYAKMQKTIRAYENILMQFTGLQESTHRSGSMEYKLFSFFFKKP